MSSTQIHPEDYVIKKQRKQTIPRALKEQLWIRDMGKNFEGKCRTSWCKNRITIFDFQCGHDIPESKGGPTNLENLVPICSRCNTSMGAKHTFKEWTSKYAGPPQNRWKKIVSYITCIPY